MLALAVISLPVTDIDRATAFYVEHAGFILDVDYRPTAEFGCAADSTRVGVLGATSDC